MKISIIVTDPGHPVVPFIHKWMLLNPNYEVSLVNDIKELPNHGDILFLISCHDLIRSEVRNGYRYSLVIHASDLPSGKGWSPHIWKIIDGKNRIPLSLISAEDSIDSGDVWRKEYVEIEETDLFSDINRKFFLAEIKMIDWACKNIKDSSPIKQTGKESYFRRRLPKDSELDLDKTIREQFNLMRVCDPNRYPAYIVVNNKKIKIILESYDYER